MSIPWVLPPARLDLCIPKPCGSFAGRSAPGPRRIGAVASSAVPMPTSPGGPGWLGVPLQSQAEGDDCRRLHRGYGLGLVASVACVFSRAALVACFFSSEALVATVCFVSASLALAGSPPGFGPPLAPAPSEP